MTIEILGRKRGKYNPDLAKKVNEAYERGKIILDRKEDNSKEIVEESKIFSVEEIVREMNLPPVPVDKRRMDTITRTYYAYLDNIIRIQNIDFKNPPKYLKDLKANRHDLRAFTNVMHRYKGLGKIFDWDTSDFMNIVMQLSDFSLFVLDLVAINASPLRYIGRNLSKKLIGINGNVRAWLGANSDNCTYVVRGSVNGHVGNKNTENCKFYFDGNYVGSNQMLDKSNEVYLKIDNKWKRV